MLENLREVVTRPSYETWIKDTECLGISGSIIFIKAPSAYVAEMLEGRMYSLIRSAIRDVVGHEIEIEFVASEQEDRD